MADRIISQEFLKEIFDYKDGNLYWIKPLSGKAKHRKIAGNINKKGRSIGIYNKNYLAHRLIFLWHYGYLPKYIDHIDGNPRNNVIENLRLLFPNCHSQTDTYCGKNYNRNKKSNHCLGCDKKLSSTWATRCIQCFSDLKSSQTKIIWPDKETLTNLIKTRKMEYIAKKLGVTSSSIKKHCKKIGINYQDAKYGI